MRSPGIEPGSKPFSFSFKGEAVKEDLGPSHWEGFILPIN